MARTKRTERLTAARPRSTRRATGMMTAARCHPVGPTLEYNDEVRAILHEPQCPICVEWFNHYTSSVYPRGGELDAAYASRDDAHYNPEHAEAREECERAIQEVERISDQLREARAKLNEARRKRADAQAVACHPSRQPSPRRKYPGHSTEQQAQDQDNDDDEGVWLIPTPSTSTAPSQLQTNAPGPSSGVVFK